tara:strand:+ start:5340 stop:6002 length:663 start_codon:yes stop_codon:yes gene_type:complete
MNLTELQKRFLTALFLIPFAIFMISYSKKIFLIFLLSVLFFSFYEWFKLNKKKVSLISLLGFIFISISIYFAYFLRGNDGHSILEFILIIFICIFSDVGGFFFGKAFGGKKITKISPNKTYSGMYGSFIFSILPILILYFYNQNLLIFNNIVLSWKNIFFCILFSLTCQLGDITVSFFKRRKKIKDTGKLLPGHGGLLDRIDGLIFVIVFSGILKILNII